MSNITKIDKEAFWESVRRILQTRRALQARRKFHEVRQNFGIKVRKGEQPTLFPSRT